MFNRQVLGLLCLLCWMAGTLAQSCDCADQAFKTECDKATVEERGVASDVDLRCPPGETLTQRKLATDVSAATDMSATFITFNTGDSSKYTVSGNTLRIINLQPQDEGLYRCTGPEAMTFCVLVINPVEFESCMVTEEGSSCVETVEVFRGDPVTFNTRLRFDSTSVCKCKQEIARFNFVNAFNNLNLQRWYSCDQNRTCRNISGEFIRIGNPFNFTLTIPPLCMEVNESKFELVVAGIVPMSPSSTNLYNKDFTVLISDPPDTDPTSSTTELSTVNTPAEPSTITALVVGVVTSAVCLLALLVMIGSVFVYCQYGRRKHNTTGIKSPFKNKNDDSIYAEIDDRRGSKNFSSFKGQAAPHELSTTLESVSIAA
ncbi:uncharacterized protein LOC135332071 isoform X2 [Halichondria panicea]|uniref:uncharacterized protein LOC135332071 isoform X2 n=1 Tax=Halichondria panicea TaxID=6063 RepID=UPI00312B6A7D